MEDTYVTVSAFARQIGISRPTLYSHIERGNLKATKLGQLLVVTKTEADRFKSRLIPVDNGTERQFVVYKPEDANV